VCEIARAGIDGQRAYALNPEVQSPREGNGRLRVLHLDICAVIVDPEGGREAQASRGGKLLPQL
jgi:hypothetical protein